MWSSDTSALDVLVIVGSAVLSVLTINAWSYPVAGTDAFYLLALAWPLAAIGWSLSLLASVERPAARAASGALLIGSILAVVQLGFPLLLVALLGLLGIALVVAVGLGLFAVVLWRSPRRRIAWFVPPAMVLATIALAASGVPRLVRFMPAEPEFTAYAAQVDRNGVAEEPVYFDEPISIGSVPVHEIYLIDRELHFVTNYVGILADDGAGVAYLPDGVPDNELRYDQLLGSWYRWFPY